MDLSRSTNRVAPATVGEEIKEAAAKVSTQEVVEVETAAPEQVNRLPAGLNPEGLPEVSPMVHAHELRRKSSVAMNTETEAPLDIQKNEFASNGQEDSKGSLGCLIPEVTFIMHPYSSLRLGWDIWIVFLLIYTSLMVPYALAFQDVVCTDSSQGPNVGDLILLWGVDVCFWIDIFLNFRTAIIDPAADNMATMQLITDWKVIGKGYLTGWFFLDVLGSFPIQVVEAALMEGGGCSLAALKALRLNRLARLARLLKLIRLARLARWGRLITKAKDALSINPGHLRLLQFILLVFVLAHFLACILYGMVDWEDGFATNWASEVQIVVPGSGNFVLKCPPPITFTNETSGEEEIQENSLTRYTDVVRGGITMSVPECRAEGSSVYLRECNPMVKYIVSLYVTFTTLTTVGYGDITMKTTPELIYAIMMMAVGASTFAVVIGNMAALLGKMDVRASNFKERMEDLDDFMHQENLPLDLRFRTRAFFEYRYNHSRDIPQSIEELSLSLRSEVALHLYNDLITTVPFFCNCGKEFLTDIILRLKAQTLSPGDYLYEAGEYGDSMYFLIKGSVEVVLDDKHGVFAELKEGSFFGEHCVLGLSEHRPVSVRAMTWCNLFCLTQQALEDSIFTHPEAHEHFRSLAHTQSAEKTMASAVKDLSATKKPRSPKKNKLFDDAHLHTPMDHPTDVEPPVVTRALMRARKGNVGSGGPGLRNVQNMGGSLTNLGSDLGDSTPAKGSKAEDDEQKAKSDMFSRAIMTNVSAAQKQSHVMREQLRSDLDKLHAQLKAISNDDTA